MNIPKTDFKIGGDAELTTLVRNLPQKSRKTPIRAVIAIFLLDLAQTLRRLLMRSGTHAAPKQS
jgi:hypothetical protein